MLSDTTGDYLTCYVHTQSQCIHTDFTAIYSESELFNANYVYFVQNILSL